jgi:hypothetical protein
LHCRWWLRQRGWRYLPQLLRKLLTSMKWSGLTRP